ncbi:MAG: molybdenum cofactor guanylyltransferase MobA [Oceanospirillaceae bacterium]|nr:molybdenum cofactor guanylyltransferase MobA [Oceanospirillaceae bacterium]
MKKTYTGLVLAGGRSRRMGGQDKGLALYKGKPLVEYALEALKPHCTTVFINSNRNLAGYSQYGLPVIQDLSTDFPGPLQALSELLPRLPDQGTIILPCDTPGVTASHVMQLIEHAEQTPTAWIYLRAPDHDHPLHAYLPRGFAEFLQQHLAITHSQRVMKALSSYPETHAIDIADDAEFNINRLDDADGTH